MFSPIFERFLGKRKEQPSPTESESSNDDGANSQSGEDSDDEEMVDSIDDTQVVSNEEFDEVTATMGQLLTRIIPDADIHSSNVIIIGGQSSGKTKMIISMVFHHLIDNPSFTNQMGEKLLKLFRTGEKMVTRRPTEIRFEKALPGSPCNISLQLGKDSANFDDPKFDEIVAAVHYESVVRDGKAFEGKLKVTICAPDLPNMYFTDLPGLITDDREVSDADGLTIRKLVKRYMRQPATTLIVVEPAATEDFDTSQVAPMIRDMRDRDRPHIFNNAVLVLSKCDKIRRGLEPRIMSLIDLTSPNIRDYPFKHVVGVVNKIEVADVSADLTTDTEIPSTFAEFKSVFRATKRHEKDIFSVYRDRQGAPCSTTSQCTTAAVFHQMDTITFNLVHQSIQRGLQSLQDKVEDTKQRIRSECAPPLNFYDQLVKADDTDGPVVDKAGRQVFIEEMRYALKRRVATELKTLQLYHKHMYDQGQIAASQTAFLEAHRIHWPAGFVCGDMSISQKQQEATAAIRKCMNKFIDKEVRLAVIHVLEDEATGCFSSIHSRFHRIDRFPRLVEALYNALLSFLPECCEAAKATVEAYLSNFWDFEVPKGKVDRERILSLLEELKHIAIRKLFEKLRDVSKSVGLEGLVLDDELMEERADFAKARAELQTRWESLHRQEAILQRCEGVKDNNSLRATLEAVYSEQEHVLHTSEAEWLQFWDEAKEAFSKQGKGRVNPPCTVLFDAAVSPSLPARVSSEGDEMNAGEHEEIYHPTAAARTHSSSSAHKRAKRSHHDPSSQHSDSQDPVFNGWASYQQQDAHSTSQNSTAAPSARSTQQSGVIGSSVATLPSSALSPSASAFLGNVINRASSFTNNWQSSLPSAVRSAVSSSSPMRTHYSAASAELPSSEQKGSLTDEEYAAELTA